jgi:tetrahydromethanopterin S-methyltransferase subunit D
MEISNLSLVLSCNKGFLSSCLMLCFVTCGFFVYVYNSGYVGCYSKMNRFAGVKEDGDEFEWGWVEGC